MLKISAAHGRILFAAVVIAFASPAVSKEKDHLGHDWYCPDPEAHEQYEKHRKMHMETDAEIIVDMLDKVYNDSAFTAEQKRTHALKILKKDPSELGKGQGVGD
jgi:hypothetical protein